MPEQEVSHLEIYRLLIEVKTTLDMALKQRVEDKKRDDDEKLDIFRRLNDLEKRPDPTPLINEVSKLKERVAQGVILLAALVFFSPLIWQSIGPRLHFPQPVVEASPSGQ